jgi:hypothetical protein
VGLAVLIIGIPFAILFLGSVRVLSLVEGRIVEAMLGERMPRRPLYSARGKNWLERIKDMFTDPRTWSTLLYMVAMLPLGITVLHDRGDRCSPPRWPASPRRCWSASAAWDNWYINAWDMGSTLYPWQYPIVFVGGVVLLFATLPTCARHRPHARAAGQAPAGEVRAVRLMPASPLAKSEASASRAPGRR